MRARAKTMMLTMNSTSSAYKHLMMMNRCIPIPRRKSAQHYVDGGGGTPSDCTFAGILIPTPEIRAP